MDIRYSRSDDGFAPNQKGYPYDKAQNFNPFAPSTSNDNIVCYPSLQNMPPNLTCLRPEISQPSSNVNLSSILTDHQVNASLSRSSSSLSQIPSLLSKSDNRTLDFRRDTWPNMQALDDPCSENQWHDEVSKFDMKLNSQSAIEKTRIRSKKLADVFEKTFDKFRNTAPSDRILIDEMEEEELCVAMSPIESFMGVPKVSRKKHFYDYLEQGDILCVKVINRNNYGLLCVVICMDGGKRREVHDCDIRVFCPTNQCLPLSVNHSKDYDGYQAGDIIRVTVLSFNPSQTKILVSMKPESLPKKYRNLLRMGLINDEELPVHHRRFVSMKCGNYDDMLKKTLSFNNPGACAYISSLLNLPLTRRLTFIPSLKGEFSQNECSKYLRKKQSEEWARQSVEEGIHHLKLGNHLEAHQSLNKALQIDTENLDALIARGCLFANTNNLVKSLEDFEKALLIDPYHANARKYLSQTLFAWGKLQEEKGNLDAAIKAFRKAYQVNTKNCEALDALKTIENSKLKINIKSDEEIVTKKQIGSKSEEEDASPKFVDDGKKKKHSKKKVSSESSLSSSTSSSSSSYSYNSSSSTDHSSKKRKKKKSRKHRSKHSKKKSKSSRKEKSFESKLASSALKDIDHRNKKITIQDEDFRIKPSTSRNLQRVPPKRPSPKVFFVLKKPDPDPKTLPLPIPAKLFDSSPSRSSTHESRGNFMYNAEKTKSVSKSIRNTNTRTDRSLIKKKSSTSTKKMYLPGRSKSSSSRSRSHSFERSRGRSRSRSNSRVRRRNRSYRSRSKSSLRSFRRYRSKSRSLSPRRSIGRPTVRNYGGYRRRFGRISPRSSDDDEPIISRAPDPGLVRNRGLDRFRKAAEEAKKIEAIVTGQKGVLDHC